MRYPLDAFLTIPADSRRCLQQHGITDTDLLLNRAATPADRQSLAALTGLDPADLFRWAGIADLLRIKGIGPASAELIVAAGEAVGVSSFLDALAVRVADRRGRLAEHDDVTAAADALADRLRDFVADDESFNSAPSAAALAEAAEEGAELVPRLVADQADDLDEFMQRIRARYDESRRHGRGIRASLVALIAAVSVILLIAWMIFMRREIGVIIANDDIITSAQGRFLQAVMPLTHWGLAVAFLLVVILLAGTYVLSDFLSYVQRLWISRWLFNTPTYRAFFWKIMATSQQQTIRVSWWAVGIIVLLAAGVTVSALATVFSGNMAAPGEELSRLILPVTVVGVIIGVVVSVPALRIYLDEIRISRGADNPGIQRYMIYILANVIQLPLLVWVLAQLALPLAMNVQGVIYREAILPRIEPQVRARYAELAALGTEDEIDQDRLESLLAYNEAEFISQLDTYGLVISPTDRSLFDEVIPLALNAVVGIVLVAYLLLFLLPYLMLGGWRRGLFYIALLGVTFVAENWLQQAAPTWFALEPGTLPAGLMIAFALFGSALLFDWLYDLLTERPHTCPACAAQIDADDTYCSVCGLAQT